MFCICVCVGVFVLPPCSDTQALFVFILLTLEKAKLKTAALQELCLGYLKSESAASRAKILFYNKSVIGKKCAEKYRNITGVDHLISSLYLVI